MLRLLDHRFDDLAVEAHRNLAPRAAVAVGASVVAAQTLPWRACLAWLVVGLGLECWTWFASRPQMLGRTVGRPGRLNYLASLVCLILNWCVLGWLFWRMDQTTGALSAMIIWLSVLGFAQTFASRTPIGFTVCGVLPGLGVVAVVLASPQYAAMPRGPVVGILMLAVAFAIAGARQTFAAGRKLEQTQDQLLESEFQHRVLAENITDLILRRGLDSTWRYVSPSVEAALGHTPDEFRALDPSAYTLPEDRALLGARFTELLKTGGSCTFEHRVVRKDGSISWMESSYVLLSDPVTGAPQEMLSTSRDINHRKAMEADLIQARINAEAAGAAKADFLANMTHELRTPLNAIVGFSGTLQNSTGLSERDARHAQLINAASKTLLAVVNGVLDFSKLESDEFEFDPQPFDPVEMAKAVALMIGEQATQRGLYLRVVTKGEPLSLHGDAPRLQQVLLNLLSNALKFTLVGGVEVVVEETPPARGGLRRLRIDVSDTGVGIPQDKLSAIFERFSQADASVSRHFGGTGLGLAISKRLIERMGGQIGVTSTEGEGSTFWLEIELPAAETAKPTSAEEREAVELDRPLRLLLVEDNAVNQELIQVFLEPFDIEIETAVNGAEAVEAVRRARYDLVLMDVQMPVMDGMTATRLIRAMPEPGASRLPIIAMTANVLPEQVQRCLEAGMDAHIGKPIAPARLLEMISQWSAGEDQVAELRRSA